LNLSIYIYNLDNIEFMRASGEGKDARSNEWGSECNDENDE
jgi:hypothetical protein